MTYLLPHTGEDSEERTAGPDDPAGAAPGPEAGGDVAGADPTTWGWNLATWGYDGSDDEGDDENEDIDDLVAAYIDEDGTMIEGLLYGKHAFFYS